MSSVKHAARQSTASRTLVVVDPLTVRPVLWHTLTMLSSSPLRLATAPLPLAPGAVIISVERFFHDTLTQQAWISAGQQVLPVLFDEHTVTIGPVCQESWVCGTCCNEQLAAADPSWRDRALQRMGKRAINENPVVLAMVAGLVCAALQSHFSSQREHTAHRQYVLHTSGKAALSVSVQNASVHPSCPNHASVLTA